MKHRSKNPIQPVRISHTVGQNIRDSAVKTSKSTQDDPTEVMSKLLERYFNVICSTLNSILEEQQIISINSKLQALRDEVIADNYNYGYSRLIEDLRNYEKKLNKVIKEYDDQVVIEEKKTKSVIDDGRRFFDDDDDGRQIF